MVDPEVGHFWHNHNHCLQNSEYRFSKLLQIANTRKANAKMTRLATAALLLTHHVVLPFSGFSALTTDAPFCDWVKNTAFNEVEALTNHVGLWDETESLSKRARKKLKPRHKHLFSSSSLFDEFASVICETGIMARKEVFETWAAALFIYERFFETTTRRVCDVAAGHGLLAWALLVIDDYDRRWAPRKNDEKPLTAFCVDRRMPPSAETIQSAMEERWPHLRKRFDFVEGSLEQLEPHPTCLLTSVHACGGLSDLLVASAAASAVPIALVPCCHSRKKLVGASLFAQEEYDAIINAENIPDLAKRLDEARKTALLNAGFNVESVLLPERFTAQNHLIMASPLVNGPRQLPNHPLMTKKTSNLMAGGMPPLDTAKARFLKKISIPCEDSPASQDKIKELSGRVSANRRRNALHRKNHTDAPVFDVSLWLPPGKDGIVSEISLTELGESITDNITCTATQIGKAFVNSSGRRAKTFRLRYEYAANRDAAVLSDMQAKKLHSELYKCIPGAFPGAECR